MFKRNSKLLIICIGVALFVLCFFIVISNIFRIFAEESIFEQSQIYGDKMPSKDVNIDALETKSSSDKSEYVNLGGTRLSEGEQGLTQLHYIENANYFLANPKHRENYKTSGDHPFGTCTTVAHQILLGYHNYYSDRRLIPEISSDGKRYLFENYGDLNLDPMFIYDPEYTYLGRENIGTTDEMFYAIFNRAGGDSLLSQTIGNVADASDEFLEDCANGRTKNWTITNSNYNKQEVMAELNAGRPVIIGFDIFGEHSSHVVVAYGYATYNGKLCYITHYGWDEDNVQMLVPESWLGYQVTMQVDHTHNSVDAGNIIHDTHRELRCTTCDCHQLDELYLLNTAGDTITGYKYDLEGLVTIPSEINDQPITGLAANLFKNQTEITQILLPNTLTAIGNNAFSGASNLVSVTFTNPSSSQLTTIGAGAFADCTSLTRFGTATYFYLTLPSSITSIGPDAFKETKFRYISIGANVTNISETSFSDIDTLISFTVTSGNTKYMASDGVLYNSDGWLMQYPVAKTGTSFSIPETVNGTAIKFISPYAFEGSNLTTVNLSYIITIEEGAFKNCSVLTTLTGDDNIEYIGAYAFDGTPIALRTDKFIVFGKVLYRYNGTDTILNETDFPSAVNRIAPYAFSNNTNLQTINLPLSVRHIDSNAFDNCSNLSSIRYLNASLPSVGINAFEDLASDFKFYCRKGLIDGVTSSSDWAPHSAIMSPVKTDAYFEDINEHVTFYYGETVEIPKTPISGYYNKGWLRVNTETDETYGGYLTPSIWTETVATATFRADLLVLESYTLYFYNGDVEIGAFNISIGDTYEITQQGYSLNGGSIVNFAYSTKMTNCAYNEYYGPAVVNGVTIASFDGWLLNGSVLESGQWTEYYDDNALYVYANWTPVEFTVTYNNGYGGTSTGTFNYCDGLTLPEPTRSGYHFKGWKNNSTGTIMSSPVQVASDLSLTAQWVRAYTIYYQNLTFDGKTADVLLNYEIGNYAPTEYEYGVGLNLSDITAYWQADGPYSPHLKFLGWYTSKTFTTKVTSISTTSSGNVYLYAKWRYDKDNPSRSGTYTITDSGRFNQSYDQFTIGLAEYNDLVDIGIEYLAITLKINMWEVDEGYQYIFIYDGSGSNDTLLWDTKITFGGSGKDTTPGVKEYQIYIPIDKLKDVQYLYIRYGASGAFGDTWRNDQIYLELMYVVDQNDIYDPEFNWSYQDPFD